MEKERDEDNKSPQNKEKKSFKVFAYIMVSLFLVIALVLMVFMISNTYYIKNHPCEICIDKYGASCILNEAIYYKEEGVYKSSPYLINPSTIPKQENKSKEYPSEEEIEHLFSNIYNEEDKNSI